MATYKITNKEWFKEKIKKLQSYAPAEAEDLIRRAEASELYAKTDPRRECHVCHKPFGGYSVELLDQRWQNTQIEFSLQKHGWIWTDNKAYCPDCILHYFKIGLEKEKTS
jgi:hypothetical protein